MNEVVTKDQIMAQARGEPASQATVIEQSRAIAEVQGALVVAQQRPRDQTMALERIREAAKQLSLAEQAFFKFPRGGETVSGESIHLAVELARCWGNIAYGISELNRSDRAGESEMLAYAWDLETNTRAQMGFIVPHRRDTRSGVKALTDMRDIYENNANMGARRLRECIFRVLPTHVREIGKATCLDTLQKGESEKPLAVRLTQLFEVAEKQLGISRDRIEAKLGPARGMTVVDAASLHVSLRSVKRGEVSADEEFPRVGTEEATAAARKLAEQRKGGKAEAKGDPEPHPTTVFEELERTDGDQRKQDEVPVVETEGGDAHPAQAAADQIIADAGRAENIMDLNSLRSRVKAHVEAMPDVIGATVTEALDRAEKRLKGAK